MRASTASLHRTSVALTLASIGLILVLALMAR